MLSVSLSINVLSINILSCLYLCLLMSWGPTYLMCHLCLSPYTSGAFIASGSSNIGINTLEHGSHGHLWDR